MTTDHTDTSIGVLIERFATDAYNKNFVVNLSIGITMHLRVNSYHLDDCQNG